MRDPKILNKVLGAKLWWRWVQGGNDVWKRIWNQKYNMPDTTDGRLRAEETPRGSQTWELAIRNRDIVKNYAFWEIWEGNSARFWGDGWKQRDKLEWMQTLL